MERNAGIIWKILAGLILTCGLIGPAQAKTLPPAEGERMTIEPFKAADTVGTVLKHPAFKEFSRLLFPVAFGEPDHGMPLKGIDPLLPYHSHIRVETTVAVLNHLADDAASGRTVFYDFYTDGQKQLDSNKKDTGLFFFRGNPGAPFAVVCPGGGFSYVGSIHEGFPQAMKLSQKGYNAFVLKYRVGSGKRAMEDLAAALTFIFRNAETLGVSTPDYSLWGGSAGARMAAAIGSYGASRFGGGDVPRPAAVIMGYTGYSDFAATDPATFVMVSADDPIVNVRTVERRVEAMRRAGVDIEYHRYRNAGHGFGLGLGTDAEGWIDHAVRFWERHMSLRSKANS